MKNKSLAEDYIIRAGNRLAALEVLMNRKSYPDVVRGAQEIVELSLKSLLRHFRIEVPRIHDVSDVLEKEASKFPGEIKPHLKKLSLISRNLRRDRELAFYGSEDLTPLEFYREEDASEAFKNAQWVHTLCRDATIPKYSR